jgi:hypothetical protein
LSLEGGNFLSETSIEFSGERERKRREEETWPRLTREQEQ